MNVYMTAIYDSGNDFDLYFECAQMSIKSVFNFMPDFHEHILLSGKESDPFEILRKTYHGIMNEVKKGNNIFFMEPDCIMVKPVEGIFKFDKMEMFARTSPWSITYGRYRFDPYMNSGVKYFPGNLPKKLVKEADRMISYYDKSFWGYDQIVYNWLYYEQHDQATIRTHLNYMPFPDFHLDIKEKDASIIHLCSSRGVKECRDKMKKYYNKINW